MCVSRCPTFYRSCRKRSHSVDPFVLKPPILEWNAGCVSKLTKICRRCLHRADTEYHPVSSLTIATLLCCCCCSRHCHCRALRRRRRRSYNQSILIFLYAVATVGSVASLPRRDIPRHWLLFLNKFECGMRANAPTLNRSWRCPFLDRFGRVVIVSSALVVASNGCQRAERFFACVCVCLCVCIARLFV